ncbi:hypothetical protein QW131_28000 [Roseibium salinum]|nr:hypothetical protein [Roseibium salinum]
MTREDGTRLMEGVAEVAAPTQTIEFDPRELPALLVQRYRHFNRIIQLAKKPCLPCRRPSLPRMIPIRSKGR